MWKFDAKWWHTAKRRGRLSHPNSDVYFFSPTRIGLHNYNLMILIEMIERVGPAAAAASSSQLRQNPPPPKRLFFLRMKKIIRARLQQLLRRKEKNVAWPLGG
jgi:hypothetical protein